MRDWERLFERPDNSGVYLIAEDALPAFRKAAAEAGLALFDLNLAGADGKSAFLDSAARALHFPLHFGYNWDAFEDCITDLSWIEASGYALLVQNLSDFSRNAPLEMSTARTILSDAAAYWKGQKVRFFVGLAENGK